jgi:hypothetical protein
MITFKKNIKELLPYDRQEYYTFKNWYGVSLQLPGVFEGKVIPKIEFIQIYEPIFVNIVTKLDNGKPWIVNHEFEEYAWFPNRQKNLPKLRGLFEENNIPNEFKGALMFSKEDLLKYAKDLMIYPNRVINGAKCYQNIDISHSDLPFVIKTSGHTELILVSTDKNLLREIVDQNSPSPIIKRELSGTSLW